MLNFKNSLFFLAAFSACGVDKDKESKEHDSMRDYDRKEGMFLVDKETYKGDVRGQRIFDLCVKSNKTEMESAFLTYIGESINKQENRSEELVMSCSKLATEVPNLKSFSSMAVNRENSKFDYSYFKDFTSLELLSITFGDMGDFSQISELTQLKDLFIHHSTFHDTTKLSKLKNLEEIMLHKLNNSDNSQVTNYAFLKELPNIKVAIWNEKDFNLDSFKHVKSLRFYELKDDQVLVELKQLPNLKQLEISDIDDTKLKLIGELDQLEELSISTDKPTCDVSLLANLKNLKSLEIDSINTTLVNCPTDSKSLGVNKFCTELKKK